MDKIQIRNQLTASIPVLLVDELLESHQEAKEAFYLGGLRLSEIEGGRFCEAAFRILEYVSTGSFTPIGSSLSTDGTIQKLSQLPNGSHPDSIRLHIPRSLRLVYDIRNKRDAAHLADGIDPNLQDSTLVCSVLDWVLAELIRLYHKISADAASEIVDDLVARTAPIVEDFDGFLKVLEPSLGASDYCLVLLYQRGSKGAELSELETWVKPSMRPNLRRTMNRLINDLAFVHESADIFIITRTGKLEVEDRRLLEP